ncbi:MAG: hypothetical protein WC670_12160 [Pseudolabrys sp.]|jgi:hypothetical protein
MQAMRCSTLVLSVALAALSVTHPAQAQGLAPEPMPIPPLPAAVIDGWIAADNQAAIRDHAWQLWAAINTPSKSGDWPIWETWYSDAELNAGPPSASPARVFISRFQGRPVRTFELPRQFTHTPDQRSRFAAPLAADARRGDQVLANEKFDPSYASHVWQNNLQKPGALWTVQNAWPAGTPVPDRKIVNFPPEAVGLKPIFEVVRGPNNQGGVTLLNYWLGDLVTGPGNSTDPQVPWRTTWKQCVVVNTGTAAPPAGLTCPNGGAPSGTVSQRDFYSFTLGDIEVASICALQNANPCTVAAGDYAVLVSMHITTRENDNWTWQTLWWNYGQPFPYGPPPASVPAPYNHYAMCTAYSMTVNPPNNAGGKNTLCYNPYLEPAVPDGIHSNCLTCHGNASIGNNPNNPGYPTSYSPTAYISPTVPADVVKYFGCQTTTDTSWYVAARAGSATGTQPPCNLPAVK